MWLRKKPNSLYNIDHTI